MSEANNKRGSKFGKPASHRGFHNEAVYAALVSFLHLHAKTEWVSRPQGSSRNRPISPTVPKKLNVAWTTLVAEMNKSGSNIKEAMPATQEQLAAWLNVNFVSVASIVASSDSDSRPGEANLIIARPLISLLTEICDREAWDGMADFFGCCAVLDVFCVDHSGFQELRSLTETTIGPLTSETLPSQWRSIYGDICDRVRARLAIAASVGQPSVGMVGDESDLTPGL